jgi:uncharacterized Ntn-hydrolase superfamily protein
VILAAGWAAGGLAVFCSSTPAFATYSIVASDRATRQVGGAGTSCLGGSDVYIIYGAVPGVGAVHAQAQFNQAGRNRAVQLLGQMQTPAQVVDAITTLTFDANAASRQYGVVDVTGRSAGFTGGSTLVFADDVQGSTGAFTYSIQGNILTGAAVLRQAVAGFEAPACDLAARLMAALEAGGANGQGDSRCTDTGIPSDSAFLQVDLPDAELGSFLSLRVPTSGAQNPLVLLRAQFDTWRASSACSALPVDAGVRDAASDSSSARDAASVEAAPDVPPDIVPPEPSPDAPLEPPPSASEPVAAASARSSGGCSVPSRAASTSSGPGPVGVIATGIVAVSLSVLGRRRRSRARGPVSRV